MSTPTIIDCADITIDQLCERMQVAAFDLDGTLARSKKPMHADMAQALSQLTTIVPVAIISGGAMSLIQSQVIDVLTEQADRTNMHIMPTTGTRYYVWADHAWQQVYEHDLDPQDRATAIESLTRHAKEMGLWEAQTWGTRIEDRGSQITFSALGQQAPVDAKEAWDPNNEKKNRLAGAVQRDVPHLLVRSGGSTSVDVSGLGIDKSYAVKSLARILDVPVSSMMFVGDRMDPDGNDYPAALAGTLAIRVHGPQDTLHLCNEIIAWHERHSQA